MKVIDPGHKYELDSLDGDAQQVLQFVKREGPNYPGNTGTYPGVIMQEVLRALIDRARYVDSQIPCGETRMAIRHMQEAIYQLEMRAKRVKGKSLPANLSLEAAEVLPTCAICGHILCREEHAQPA